MSTLTTGEVDALLARVEAATGADRELDALISAAVRVAPAKFDQETWMRSWTGPWQADGHGVCLLHTDGQRGPWFTAEPLTASVDTALALIGRVLPGRTWCLGDLNGGNPHAWIGDVRTAYAATPALALLAAMLRALRAQSADQSQAGEPTP